MNLDNFFLQLRETPLAPWSSYFFEQMFSHFSGSHKDSLEKWKTIIDDMPEVMPLSVDFSKGVVSALPNGELPQKVKQEIRKGLETFNPWRKGPFNICGIQIDSEWRSDMKWARIQRAMTPLKDRLVLDVGCGNGYHCFRALGDGASFVVGIDHKLTFFAQNQVLLKYLETDKTAVLPMGIDDMPEECHVFDTVLSMGVLYHVHSPVEHLQKIWGLLKNRGEVILETLVIEGEEGDVLIPESRYACMPNVRMIPSCETAIGWMKQCGFTRIRLADVTVTTTEEQHVNEWGVRQSLEHFLDPQDHTKTVEGYPAPMRAVLIAEKEEKE